MEISKAWCERMAQREDGSEIGAGSKDHPFRITFEPSECDVHCTDPGCHLLHGDSWRVGDVTYQTEDEAKAALAKARGDSI